MPKPSSPKSQSQSSEITQLEKACEHWRQNKKNKSESMPIDLQKYISRIINSKRHPNNKIIRAAKINSAKLRELATKQFADNPELMPFTLVPKDNFESKQDYKQKQTCKTASDHLLINSANGDSISVPITLDESAMQNIIKIFLCCK